MKFKKNEVVIGGRTFFYWEKNRHKSETIVLLHGFPGSHRGLLDLAGHLPPHWRTIIPDLPACGQSDALDGVHHLENYSQWLGDFLKKLSVHQCVMAGHSFGARLALVFAEHNPKKVSRLALITPVARVDGLIARLVSIEYRVAELLPEALKKIWLDYNLHRQIGNAIIFTTASKKRRQELMEADKKEFAKLDPKINIELFSEFYRFDLIPVGQKVATPSLIIAGELDQIATAASVEKLAGQLQHVALEMVKNGGHLLPLERPGHCAAIISKFLSQ